MSPVAAAVWKLSLL